MAKETSQPTPPTTEPLTPPIETDVFGWGESVLLIDAKSRRFLLKLTPGAKFQYHRGALEHSELVGLRSGSWVHSSQAGRLLAIRPRLADFILKMQRGAQVVYPKDIGPILVWADIAPGMTVIEAGTGTGALAISLARAVGETGRVISVELRSDHSQIAQRNIKRWFGQIPPQLELREGDVADAITTTSPQRIVLDLPEPWQVVTTAGQSQPPGSLFCAYLPTVPQVQTLVGELRGSGTYTEVEVFETWHRDWRIAGRSVRPEHQMVGHTGFITVARRVELYQPDTTDEQ